MKILITNIWLEHHGGTEVGVRDLAIALNKNGIAVEVYTPLPGAVAAEIEQAGIHVANSVNDLRSKPDLIHGQHFQPTMDAIIEFPDVPVVYVLRDRTFPGDVPPKLNQVVKYVAVDYNCLDRLVIDNDIPDFKTMVIYNCVDTERFKMRSHIARKPQHAVIFSNYARKDNFYKPIREACDQMGIRLDVIGMGFGNELRDPENFLPKYDLVFAKAKAAMEALATGAGVILCDDRGLGEFVTSEKFQHFRKFNFGMKTLTRPVEVSLLKAEIDRYNAGEISRTSEMIREAASFKSYTQEFIKLYRTVIDEYHRRDQLTNKAEDLQVLVNYFSQKQTDALDAALKEQQLEMQKKSEDIHNQFLKTQNELQRIIQLIIHSGSFRIGRFLTYPIRIIRRILKNS